MVRAISEMAETEKGRHGPDISPVIQTTVWQRRLPIIRAYEMAEKLANLSPEQRDDYLDRVAEETGRNRYQVEREVYWAERIKRTNLDAAFAGENITEDEWLTRVTPDHLYEISRASKQHRLLSSKECAELALESYHANWDVAELRAELISRGMRKPDLAKMAPPVKREATTFTEALELILAECKARGINFDIAKTRTNWNEPVKIHKALRNLAWTMEALYEKATVSVKREDMP